MGKRIIISESEKNQIRNMYGLTNENYPSGTWAGDPSAPWNAPDDPYEYDTVEKITEIATLTGYKNPLTLESAKRMGIEGKTEMGRTFRGTLAQYIDSAGLYGKGNQEFIDYLRSVGEEENEVYRDGGDDFVIDIDNPEIQEKLCSLGANPNELDGDYPSLNREPDYDGPDSDYERNHPDVISKEWGGMDI